MRQDREPEARKQKHNHGEHRVWIFDRHTCSSFVSFFAGDVKEFSRFSSGILASFWIGLAIYLFLRKFLSGVAERFFEIFPGDDEALESHGCARRQTLERKIEDTNLAKSPPKPKTRVRKPRTARYGPLVRPERSGTL